MRDRTQMSFYNFFSTMIAFALHPGASFTVADQIVNSVQRLDLVVVFILQSHRLQIK